EPWAARLTRIRRDRESRRRDSVSRLRYITSMRETRTRRIVFVQFVRFALCFVATSSAAGIAAADNQCFRDLATGFQFHRSRSVILLDAALQTLPPPASAANTPPPWQRALESAEWLIHRLPEGSEYSVMLGDESIDPDTASKWWRAGSNADAQRAF